MPMENTGKSLVRAASRFHKMHNDRPGSGPSPRFAPAAVIRNAAPVTEQLRSMQNCFLIPFVCISG